MKIRDCSTEGFADTVSIKIHGFSMVRNEADIIPFFFSKLSNCLTNLFLWMSCRLTEQPSFLATQQMSTITLSSINAKQKKSIRPQ